jgi:IS5 family transposase
VPSTGRGCARSGDRNTWRWAGTGSELRQRAARPQKRRHGLARSRYKGDDGMKRWVGLGVIADNLVNIGNALTKPPAP